MQKQATRKNHTYSTALVFLISIFVFSAASNFAYATETDGTMTTGGNAGYAWSTSVGWINFGIAGGNVHVTDAGMTGNAWSTLRGWINLAPSNGGITIAADGTLSGYAWGSNLGWINFSGVSINSSGKFVGQATGTLVGTLTFDCNNCSVVTDYRPQNFRTVTPPPTSGGGGGSSGGGGGGGTGYYLPATIPGISSVQNVAPATPSTSSESNNPPLLGGGTRSTGQINTGNVVSEQPAQLFDIRLLLDRPAVLHSADLVARVTFESFGRVPTPVAMTFSIINSNDESVVVSRDTTTVQTEAVFVKRFLNVATLPPGAYTLKLHTKYNTNVEDDFTAPFTITSPALSSRWIAWLIGGLALSILAILFLLWSRRRKDEDERETMHFPHI